MGIDHEGRVEGHALVQHAIGFCLQGVGIGQLVGLYPGAERQLPQGVGDEGLGDRGQFCCIHPVGLQGVVDQQLALNPIAGEITGAEHDQGGQGAKHQNERA
ncbi:hypothetical protein D3C80_1073840 [compost metagenome]